MEIRTIISKLSGPKPHVLGPKVVWPRYLDNNETHDHLTGKKLSAAVLTIEMEKLRFIWDQTQRTRYRYAIYEFLEAAYAAVIRYRRVGKGERLLKTLQKLDPMSARMRDPYTAIIHSGTSHSLDSRTRSKWSRLLRYAESKKVSSHQLEEFIRRAGGLNKACRMARK